MMNIEELMKSQWREAESVPPKAAWERLEKGLDAAAATPKTRRIGKGGVAIVASGIAVTAGLAVALLFATGKSGNDEIAQTSAIQGNVSELPTALAEEHDSRRDDGRQTVLVTDEPRAAAADQQKSHAATAMVVQQPDAQADASASVVRQSLPPVASVTANNDDTERHIDNHDNPSTTSNRPLVATTTTNITPAQHKEMDAPTKPSEPEVETATRADESAAARIAAREAIEKQLYIPNLLTPNSDGYNDCWVLKGTEGLGTIHVQIFSAKGRRVFSASDYANDFCGADLPSGNYFYVITIKEKDFTRRGVLVIRR